MIGQLDAPEETKCLKYMLKRKGVKSTKHASQVNLFAIGIEKYEVLNK